MKKLLLALTFALLLSCAFVVCVSAQDITTYDDAPLKTKIQVTTDDIVEFYDGFKCPAGYVFKDETSIPYWSTASIPSMFDFEYINQKTGKEYAFADIKGFDIPEGVTFLGQYAGKDLTTLEWISVPESVTTVGNAVFQGATGLKYCYFEHGEDSSLTSFPPYTFAGCTNLQSFSMPDSVTEIKSVCQFSICTNLKAVYLSKNLTTWETDTYGGGLRNSTFDSCTNLYLVNEPFGLGEVPEKPTVYYFPANLTTTDSAQDFSNECTFRNCNNLNDVLVFGTGVTKITNAYIFQGSPANTVVFLGDVTNVSSGWWGTSKIMFANGADLSAENLTLSQKNGQNISYCNAEDNTTHLASPRDLAISSPATCTENAYGTSYCFCGKSLGEGELTDTALGHDHSVELGAFYESYMEASYYSLQCDRCGDVKQGDKAFDAIIDYYGYSCTEEPIDGKYSMSQFYGVNADALNAYKEYTGKTFEYGLVASTGANPLSFAQGSLVASKNAVVLDSTLLGHEYFEIKIGGMSEENLSIDIVFCAYIVDGENVFYLDGGVTSGTVSGIDYKEVLEIVQAS